MKKGLRILKRINLKKIKKKKNLTSSMKKVMA